MGKKRLIEELEAALSQTLSDWAIERQANRSLREVIENDRQRHTLVVNAMTNGMQRLTEERDAAEKNVQELLRDKEASTSCIRDLRCEVAELQEERDDLRLELAGMTSYAALDAAMADIETLTQANEEADATIGDLRERLDAALTEAARMRKEWTGDVEASREIIARKTDENIKLRRDSEDTIMELRDDLARAREQTEIVSACWKRAEDLLQQRERELDALQVQHADVSEARDALHERARQWDALCFRLGISQASHIDAVVHAAQAQAAPAEPVVTLEEIMKLKHGERLIDNDGVIIECEYVMGNVGYWMYQNNAMVSGIPAKNSARRA